jgi:hydroxypyruvate reductase
MVEIGPFNGISPERAAQVRRVFSAALQAADPRQAVREAMQANGGVLAVGGHRLGLDGYRRVRLVGAGKAAQAMARGALDVLGERAADGILIAKHLQDEEQPLPGRIRVRKGGHPLPTPEGVSAARELAGFLASGGKDDLVICLISGGGSALLTLPAEGVSLADLQSLTRLLLACGADIGEINTLRKHLDQVKGGGLARLAAPARLVTLVLSDVIGSPLDVIASGPTVADPSTYADALAILRKYRLEEQAPPKIVSILRRGADGGLPETIKPGDPLLAGAVHQVVASNPQAAEAGLAQAQREGFHPLLLTTYLQGEASQAGVFLAGLLRQIAATGQPLPRPACLVVGGETTVTLRGHGLGGRNQELALGAASLLDGLPDVALASLGTDGEDGPTDAAGALVTGETRQRALAQGLDPLEFLRNNDSFRFFQALGDLVRTGPTGTNVNDLAFLFAF